MEGVALHAARPRTAPSVLSSLLASRNPLNAARTTVAPWLRGTEERVPSVIPGLLAGAIEKAPIFAPTIGEAVGKTGEAVIGPELLAAMKMMERDPTQRTDLMQGMLSSPIAYPMAAMTLYHGSPHKFDKFDLSRVGTGEGNQMYGHGIYFAEAPEVAGGYRTKLTQPDFVAIDGIDSRVAQDAQATYLDMLRKFNQGGSSYPPTARDALEKVVSDLDNSAAVAARDGNFDLFSSLKDRALNARRAFDVAVPENPGAFYTVDIPDELIEGRLLDWDAPLSEQPEAVRKALLKAQSRGDPLLEELLDFSPEGLMVQGMVPSAKGSALYKTLAEDLGGADKASEFLRAAGIPGLRYFDGQSRGSGEGTRNLVIWAQDILDKAGVTRK